MRHLFNHIRAFIDKFNNLSVGLLKVNAILVNFVVPKEGKRRKIIPGTAVIHANNLQQTENCQCKIRHLHTGHNLIEKLWILQIGIIGDTFNE